MTNRQRKSGTIDVKAFLAADAEFLRALVRTALPEVLEAEMAPRRANGRRAELVDMSRKAAVSGRMPSISPFAVTH